MNTTVATVVQMLIRLLGVIVLVLGLFMWTGNGAGLVGLHMLLGLLLVLLLWVLAFLGARAGAPGGTVGAVVVLGLLVPLLGMSQSQLLPGDQHWVIQVLHLLLGAAAVGAAESLGRRLKAARTLVAA